MLTMVVATIVVGQADAAVILLSSNGSNSIEVTPRLQQLGHTVVTQDASTWGAAFDYSAYDIVAFEFNSTNPADVGNLVSQVDAGLVGVVFFRGFGAETTAQQLGLTGGADLWWQTPTDLNVVNNSHPITAAIGVGTQNLGYTFMSRIDDPGANTTTLALGPSGAALVVHNQRRAVITPFYGHPTGHDDETAFGTQITERSIQWAAGTLNTNPVPEPGALALLSMGGIGLVGGAIRKRRKAALAA